jgi:hypothetical protein
MTGMYGDHAFLVKRGMRCLDMIIVHARRDGARQVPAYEICGDKSRAVRGSRHRFFSALRTETLPTPTQKRRRAEYRSPPHSRSFRLESIRGEI